MASGTTVDLKELIAASEREGTEALLLRAAQVEAGRRRESCREAASSLQKRAERGALSGYSFLSSGAGAGAGARAGAAGPQGAAWVLRPSGLFERMEGITAKELMVKGPQALMAPH